VNTDNLGKVVPWDSLWATDGETTRINAPTRQSLTKATVQRYQRYNWVTVRLSQLPQASSRRWIVVRWRARLKWWELKVFSREKKRQFLLVLTVKVCSSTVYSGNGGKKKLETSVPTFRKTITFSHNKKSFCDWFDKHLLGLSITSSTAMVETEPNNRGGKDLGTIKQQVPPWSSGVPW
jgi:hypothetical protein